jgi:hypothetical protein
MLASVLEVLKYFGSSRPKFYELISHKLIYHVNVNMATLGAAAFFVTKL